MNPVLAVPFGLAFVLWELRTARLRGITAYTGTHTWANLRCGALRVAGSAVVNAPLLAVYHGVQQSLGAMQLDASAPATWAFGLVLYDLIYYWEHRLSHRHGLLWTVHSVHHQSTEYNLTMGFRVGALGPLSAFPFFLPMAFMGLPVSIYLGAMLTSTIAMFVLHSRFLGNFGPLRALLNSPAAHRMHHGAVRTESNANFGGVLIVWDRLFGTYRRAADPAVYGLGTEAPASAWRANVEPIVTWFRSAGRAQAIALAKGVLVYGTVVLAVWAIARTAPSLSVLALLLLPAIVLTDFMSGLTHWVLDQHVSPETGRFAWLAKGFHVHHDRPGLTGKLPFYENTWETALFMAPVIALTTLLCAPGATALLVLLVATMALLAPSAHKLSHKRSPSTAVRWLQARGVLLSPKAHAKHHQGDHTRALCVFTGWCNPVLDRVDFWQRALPKRGE